MAFICCFYSTNVLYFEEGHCRLVLTWGDEMIISVCGTISSGKTTLAKKICKLFNFSYVPRRRTELNFLNDFFQDIPYAFFKTQVSFLISKILEIEDMGGKNIVIDRSLYEDIHIFAQLWMDLYPIDEKEKALYISLANYLCSTIKEPSVYVVCKCKWETICNRFAQREKRQFEELYPDNYLQELFNRYQQIKFPDDAYVIEIDTDIADVRSDNVVIDIVNFIVDCIKKEDYRQLSIFDAGEANDEAEAIPQNYIRVIQKPKDKSFNLVDCSLIKKRIYLAAPFTEFATEEPTQRENQISMDLDTNREYNVLPAKYQRYLSRLKKILSCDDEYDVILPHKDENNWGKTYKTSEQIVKAMVDNMASSDLVVAIVSNSIGVHMEIAMMGIQKKPMVLFVLDKLSSGFYADGFSQQENVKVIHVDSLEDVSKAIEQENILSFIRGKLEDE